MPSVSMLRVALSLVTALTAQASGATIFVNAAAPAGGNGSSWAAAFKDLRTALIVASSGDEVWVARGLYRPNTLLDRGLRFDIPSGVKVFGGFAGNEASPATRPADPDPENANVAHDTILSGEIGAPGLADNTVTVVDLSFSSTSTEIDRLVITEGSNEAGRGGGMRIANGSPKVTNCLIVGNYAAEGGGLWILQSSGAVFEGCVFKSNTASYAGSIAVQSSSPTFRRTRFLTNSSTFGGGAIMHSFGGGGTYEFCDFVDCLTGGVGGGAMYTIWQPTAGTLTISDCTFTNCRSAEAPNASSGGALFTNGAGAMTVTRCTFDLCRGYGGAAVNNQGGHSITYSQCAFRNGVSSFGGAAHTFNSVAFNDCLFENNRSGAGGAVQHNGPATFTGCEFIGNSVVGGTSNGGAVYMHGTGTFIDCLFQSNTTNAGGAMYAAGGAHTVDRCRFIGNSVTASGACLFASGASSVIFTNSLLAGNQAGFFGSVSLSNASGSPNPVKFVNCTITGNSGGFSVVHGFTPSVLANCILRNSGTEIQGNVTATYSNIEGGYAGAGNIDADPLFADAPAGDYSLAAGSPCIDAGDTSALALPEMDLMQSPRLADDLATPDTGAGAAPVIDIGAFEFQPLPPPMCQGDANADLSVDFADITSVLANFNLAGPAGDANHDGVVNFSDITSVLSNFGLACP